MPGVTLLIRAIYRHAGYGSNVDQASHTQSQSLLPLMLLIGARRADAGTGRAQTTADRLSYRPDGSRRSRARTPQGLGRGTKT